MTSTVYATNAVLWSVVPDLSGYNWVKPPGGPAFPSLFSIYTLPLLRNSHQPLLHLFELPSNVLCHHIWEISGWQSVSPLRVEDIFLLFAKFDFLSKHIWFLLHVQHAAAVLLQNNASHRDCTNFMVLQELSRMLIGDIFSRCKALMYRLKWQFWRIYWLANRSAAM